MTRDFSRGEPLPRRHGLPPSGNTLNRPQRPGRAVPPPRTRPASRPKGPAVIAAKVPTSNKQRRRMLKAAAGRLAALVHATPASILAADAQTLEAMVRKLISGPVRDGRYGDARRLAKKVIRLR